MDRIQFNMNSMASRLIEHTDEDEQGLEKLLHKYYELRPETQKVSKIKINGFVIKSRPHVGGKIFFFVKDNQPVGFAILKNTNRVTDGKSISIIYILSKYRRNNIALSFYKGLLDKGTILESDTDQSKYGKALWDKLKQLSDYEITPLNEQINIARKKNNMTAAEFTAMQYAKIPAPTKTDSLEVKKIAESVPGVKARAKMVNQNRVRLNIDKPETPNREMMLNIGKRLMDEGWYASSDIQFKKALSTEYGYTAWNGSNEVFLMKPQQSKITAADTIIKRINKYVEIKSIELNAMNQGTDLTAIKDFAFKMGGKGKTIVIKKDQNF